MELSISFSDEELAALADILGELLPPVGPSELDRMPASRRADRLDAAVSSLRARRVVVAVADGSTEVAVPVARLIQILSRPLLSVVIHTGTDEGGWGSHVHRLAAVPEASVAHELIDGLHRLTPFATAELLHRTARMAGLDTALRPAARPVTVDDRALAKALRATSMTTVRGELADGLSAADADALDDVVAAVGGQRGALALRTRPSEGLGTGVQMAWIAGPAGTWELPLAVTPLAGSVEEDFSLLTSGPAVLQPVSGETLLDALTAVGKERS